MHPVIFKVSTKRTVKEHVSGGLMVGRERNRKTKIWHNLNEGKKREKIQTIWI